MSIHMENIMKGHIADLECQKVRVGILCQTLMIVLLTVLYAFIFNLFPMHAYAGQEPMFPGLDAEQNELNKYWSDFSKYLMELKTTPEKVKKGTDVEKGRWLFGKIADKAYDNGYQPNTGFWGRIEWAVRDGPMDRGACGDTSLIIEYAFKGAGIKSGQYIVAETWVPGPNSNHGTFSVPDENGNYKMFDLWEYGKEKGTFKGAGSSKTWNGMDVMAWSKQMYKDKYKKIKIQGITKGYMKQGKPKVSFSNLKTPDQVVEATKKIWEEKEKHRSKRKEMADLLPTIKPGGPPLYPKKLIVSPPSIVMPGGIAEFSAKIIWAGKGTAESVTSTKDITKTKFCQWSFTTGKPVPGEKGKVKVDCDIGGKPIIAFAECKIMGSNLKSTATVKVEKLHVAELKISIGEDEVESGKTVSLAATATYKNAYCEKNVSNPPGIQWTVSEGGQALKGSLRIDPDKTSGTISVSANLDGTPSNTLEVKALPPKPNRIEVTAPKSVDACKAIEFEAWGYYSNKPDARENITEKVTWSFSGRYTQLTKNSVRADWPNGTITGEATTGDLPPVKASVNVNPLSDTQPWFPLQDVSIATRVKVGGTVKNRALEFRCGSDGPSPTPATNVEWISETPEFLTCKSDGNCTGVKPGKAIVKIVYKGREITSRYVEVYENGAGLSDEDFIDRGTDTRREDQGEQKPTGEETGTQEDQEGTEDEKQDTPFATKPEGDGVGEAETPAGGSEDPDESFGDRGTDIRIDEHPTLDTSLMADTASGEAPVYPEPSVEVNSDEIFIDEGTEIRRGDDGPSIVDQPREPERRDKDQKQPLRIRPARIQRSGPSAYHIFATASRLGWAGGLSRYSVGPADQTIIDHLATAGEHARAAYETSFEPTRAWPNWKSIRSQFNSWAGQLARTRSGTYRRQLANTLAGRYGSLADQLGYQTVKDKQRAANCDYYYCKLGYLMAFGQQTLQIAQGAESNGNTSLRSKTRRDGIAHLSQAVNVMNSMERVKLASGFCVDLRDVKQWLLSIIRGGSLGNQVRTATKAWKTALERIMNQQPPPRIAQKPPPSPPPPPLEDKIKPEVRELDKDPGELAGGWYEVTNGNFTGGWCNCSYPTNEQPEILDIQFLKIKGNYIGKKSGTRYSLKNESLMPFVYKFTRHIIPGTVIYKMKRTGSNVYEGECLVAGSSQSEWRETRIIVNGESAEETYSHREGAPIDDKRPCGLILKRYKGKGERRKTAPVAKPQRRKDKIELLGK